VSPFHVLRDELCDTLERERSDSLAAIKFEMLIEKKTADGQHLLVMFLQGLCYIRTVVRLNTANMLSRQLLSRQPF
jgi:hypothetical protein